MASITLRFYESSSVSSRLIELTGRFSHVDAIGGKGKDIYLYGSRFDQVGGRPPGVQDRQPYSNSHFVDLWLEVSADQHARFWLFLWSQFTKPYDWRAILAFALERDWRQDDSWFCSELQCAALEYAGVFPQLDVTPNKIAPGPLALAFCAIGAKELKP